MWRFVTTPAAQLLSSFGLLPNSRSTEKNIWETYKKQKQQQEAEVATINEALVLALSDSASFLKFYEEKKHLNFKHSQPSTPSQAQMTTQTRLEEIAQTLAQLLLTYPDLASGTVSSQEIQRIIDERETHHNKVVHAAELCLGQYYAVISPTQSAPSSSHTLIRLRG